MSLASLGIILVVIGVVLLALIPVIAMTTSLTWGNYNITGVGGAACIVVFFIPICFSAGIPPMLTALLAIMMVIIVAIFTYIAIRVARYSHKLMSQ